MVTVDEAIIARYEREGKHFEILVDPQIAYDLRGGKSAPISKLLAVNAVFTDTKKGEKASPTDIQSVFGTTDVEKIGEIIVKKGDIQLTTEFRRKKLDEKKKQIASFISKHAMNPQTKLPHPQDRILASIGKELDKFGDDRDRILERLREELETAQELGKQKVQSVEKQIQENPLKSLLIAFIAGLFFGKLFDRK